MGDDAKAPESASDELAAVWSALGNAGSIARQRRIADLFEGEDGAARFESWSAAHGDLLLDWSKTNVDAGTRDLLLALADKAGVAKARERMFSGEIVNNTDVRPALHTALRNLSGHPVCVDGKDVMPEIASTLRRMREFADAVRSGEVAAFGGGRFRDVVHIGIGGSQLGPEMACLALEPYHDGPRIHFLANVDGASAAQIMDRLDPATTLVLVASKSFTTPETMLNARTIRAWLASDLGDDGANAHLAAVSSADGLAREFGVPDDRIFGFADWVGGRLSMWGPVGLPLMLAIGGSDFRSFMEGGHMMDRHFREAELSENLPVLLALAGIWHANVMGYGSRAILPYDHRLGRFAAFVQQVDMESNGKSRRMDGSRVARDTGPVVWGEPGTNAQHSVAQLLHQGTRIVPVEFIVARRGHEAGLAAHHRMLVANCLAQAEALMTGQSRESVARDLEGRGLSGADLRLQAAHRMFDGNRPSITIMYDRLDPYTLGRIVALYEHRVFVEAAIWGINCFDQWGVELGKVLAGELLSCIDKGRLPDDRDGSTRGLLDSLMS